MARVLLPAALRADAGGRAVVDVGGTTVRDALDRLAAELPRLERRLRDERGGLREHVQLFVGEDNIRDLAGQDTPLKADSELHVIPALSGGRGVRSRGRGPS